MSDSQRHDSEGVPGPVAPDSDRRLSRRAIRLDVAAIASLLTLLVVVNLGSGDDGGVLLALLSFAIPLLALAGTLTALKVSDREKSPLAGWALAIGILLLAPSALFVCWVAFLMTRGSLL